MSKAVSYLWGPMAVVVTVEESRLFGLQRRWVPLSEEVSR